VGDDEVLLGLSGGVDSSVVAALLHRPSATSSPACSSITACCAYREGDQVMETFARHMGVKVIRVDAEGLFLGKLAGESDPEKKRKIIGNTFIEVFEAEAPSSATSNGWPRGPSTPT
jgi:GMP synthase (glutamine-hydrolysing)